LSVLLAAYKELVYGGHLLALGTSSIAATAAFVLGRIPSWDLLLMAYLFSFGAYSINRLSDFEEDRLSHPERTTYLSGRRSRLPLIAAASFISGYALALTRNLLFFAGLLMPLILAATYSLSSKKLKSLIGISRLKEGLLVKNLAISFGWSLIPVLVGLYYLELPSALLAFSPFVFLRLMVNTIFFDLRDIEVDKAYGVGTLPARIGQAKSWALMDALDIVSAAYILGATALGMVPVFTAGLSVFTPYSLGYRYYAKRLRRHENVVRDLAADGEYVLWGIVTSIGHL